MSFSRRFALNQNTQFQCAPRIGTSPPPTASSCPSLPILSYLSSEPQLSQQRLRRLSRASVISEHLQTQTHCSPEAASLLPLDSTLFGEAVKLATIPPVTRKRKAAEATLSSLPKETLPNKRIASAASPAPVHTSVDEKTAIRSKIAPPTPVTMASNGMDSEEDFMSAMSSDEEMQDFSGEEGKILYQARPGGQRRRQSRLRAFAPSRHFADKPLTRRLRRRVRRGTGPGFRPEGLGIGYQGKELLQHSVQGPRAQGHPAPTRRHDQRGQHDSEYS